MLKKKGPFPSEADLYSKFGLAFIEPELREGNEEVDQAYRAIFPSWCR
jgi:DNA polymerase/3'-5' exonuclease PolX